MPATREEFKARMQRGREKAREERAGATSPASAIEDSTMNGKLLALMEKMDSRLNALEEKVQAVDRATPKFQPMARPEGISQPIPNTKDLMQAGQRKQGGKDAIVAIGGLIMPGYRPHFQEGDSVRLNPECEQGEALKRSGKDPSSYQGTIVGFHYVDKKLEMKYRVDFPGLTRGTRGDGFRESDLLPV